MADKDYALMIRLGEWLEKLLDDNIDSWKMIDLIKSGLHLYGITYDIKDEDPLIEAIRSAELTSKSSENTNLDHTENIIRSNDRIPDDLEFRILDALRIRSRIKRFFEEFIQFRSPWTAYLAGEHHFYLEDSSKEKQELYESIKEDIREDTKDIINNYSKLVDSYIIKKGFLQRCRVIKETPALSMDDPVPDMVPLAVLSSRAFLDFLDLGGQEYYGFCDYCDKFYLVQRKGKKKYCSDTCRAKASQNRMKVKDTPT